MDETKTKKKKRKEDQLNHIRPMKLKRYKETINNSDKRKSKKTTTTNN